MTDASPLRAALQYWRGLGAPLEHVAQRLGLTIAVVAQAFAALDKATLDLAGYPSATPWHDRTAAALIASGLERRGQGRLVIVADEGELSGDDVHELVSRIAAGLALAGVSPGHGVAVDATQRLESYLVALATLLLGAPLVRLSGITDATTLSARLAIAPVLVTVSVNAGWAAGDPNAGMVLGLDDSSTRDFAEWLDSCPAPGHLPTTEVRPGDTALIGFTSGSTGEPKCIHTSHEAVFRASEAMQAVFGFANDDVFCTATDFSALSAFRSLVSLPFLSGGCAMLPRAVSLTTPLALAQDCALHGVTRLTAVPAVLRGMVAARTRIGPMPALRTILSGSGILDDVTRVSIATAFGVPAIDYYGGREFATAIYADADGRATISSAGGHPCNCLIAIVDDGGVPVAPGDIGMIMVHSDSMMQDGLAGALPAWNSWHETGDLGRRHADGRVQVVGRRREVIKARDGSLVFPIEIEALLMALPEVTEAAVVGITGVDGIELVVAAVVASRPPTGGAAGIERRARRHVLAAAGQFRVPARVFVVDDLPRVAANKVDRIKLRGQLARRFAEDESEGSNC